MKIPWFLLTPCFERYYKDLLVRVSVLKLENYLKVTTYGKLQAYYQNSNVKFCKITNRST